LRYNVKKKQDTTTASSFSSLIDIEVKNDDLLTPIDILSIDKYSRLTLTKKAKKILSLNPEDKIIIYQEKYNKNIILKVRHKEKVEVDNWILKKSKSNSHNLDTNSNSRINNNNNKTNSFVNIKEEEAEEGKDPHNLRDKYNTLYSTPILLVDDEPDLLMAFELFLNSEGYRNVKTFSDSKNVLKHLLNLRNSSYYKLAIIDIRLPEINGIQLYQILKILHPPIKIIFITALDAIDELASICTDVKPADIIRKPIDQNQFTKIINEKVQ
jgi:CheY-like chemotaxis protein